MCQKMNTNSSNMLDFSNCVKINLHFSKINNALANLPSLPRVNMIIQIETDINIGRSRMYKMSLTTRSKSNSLKLNTRGQKCFDLPDRFFFSVGQVSVRSRMVNRNGISLMTHKCKIMIIK